MGTTSRSAWVYTFKTAEYGFPRCSSAAADRCSLICRLTLPTPRNPNCATTFPSPICEWLPGRIPTLAHTPGSKSPTRPPDHPTGPCVRYATRLCCLIYQTFLSRHHSIDSQVLASLYGGVPSRVSGSDAGRCCENPDAPFSLPLPAHPACPAHS